MSDEDTVIIQPKWPMLLSTVTPLLINVFISSMFILSIPRYEQIFAELAIELPAITQAVIGIGAIGMMIISMLCGILPVVILACVKRKWLSAFLFIPSVLISLSVSAAVAYAIYAPMIEIVSALGE